MNQIQQKDSEVGAEKATQEGNIWQGDQLFRAKEAELLKTFLLRRVDERAKSGGSRNYVLNIDSRWGSGKTFFLTRFQKQLADEGFIVTYVNAWEDDHANDPLLPVLASIDETVSKFTSKTPKAAKLLKGLKNHGLKIAISLGKHATKKLASKFFGEAVNEIPDILSTPDQKSLEDAAANVAVSTVEDVLDNAAAKLLDEFSESKKSISLFKSNLSNLVKVIGETDSKHAQIFIFVDELDRCRPTYAISMLERIKHLFNTDGVIFVLATDTSQLRHSIKAVYGNDFESSKYLLRFFDRQYHLKDPSKAQVVAQLFSTGIDSKKFSIPPGIKSPEDFFQRMVEGFQLPTRDVEQCFDMLADVATTWPFKSLIELAYLLPLIILHQQGRDEFDLIAHRLLEPGSNEYLKRHMGWRSEIRFWDRSSSTHKGENVKAIDLFNGFHAWKDLDFSEITSKTNGGLSAVQGWVGERYVAELQAIHGGQFISGKPPNSVVRQYADIVRSMSSFS